MKLHLPKVLFAAVVAAQGVQYAGAEIYTVTGQISGSTEMARATYTKTTYTEGVGYVLATGEGDVISDAWVSGTGAAAGVVSGNNTIRFASGEGISLSDKALTYTFSNWKIGGLIVDSGATEYSISAGDSGSRPFMMTDGAYSIGESFLINTSNASNGDGERITLSGTQTWTIAKDKTMTLTSGDTAVRVAAGANVTIGGEGAFKATSGLEVLGNLIVDGTLEIGGKLTTSSTITNSGTITLGSGLAVNGYSRFESSYVQYDSDGDGAGVAGATDGYLAAANITVVNGGTINKDAITSVTYNGNTLSADSLSIQDDKLILAVSSKDYYVTSTVTYSDNSVIASDVTTGVILYGGTLNLDRDLNSAATKGIIVTAEDSTINIGAGITLNNSSVSIDNGTATIAGGNTAKYNMGTSIDANAGFGENWAGTVVFGTKTSIKSQYFDLNDYGVAGSTIQFNGTTSDSYLGAARPTATGETAHTYAANIELNGDGFTIANGYGGSQYNFTGDFKGDGKLTVTKGSLTGGLAFTFKGDMSQWSGELSHSEGGNNTYTYAAAEGKNTTIGNAITAKGGTMKVNVNNAEAVAMNGKVSVTGGTLNLTNEGDGALTVKNMEVSGGKAALTGDMTVTTLSLGAGLSSDAAAVTTTGALTIGTLNVTLSDTMTVGSSYQLVSTSSDKTITWSAVETSGSLTEGLTWSITGVDPATPGTLAAQTAALVSSSTQGIWLVISEVPQTPTNVWVNSASYANDSTHMLTLNVVGANGDAITLDANGNYNIAGLVGDTTWDNIRELITDGSSTVGITLVGDGVEVVGTGDTDIDPTNDGTGNVSFYGKYYGEVNVGGSGAGEYRTDYIPEPATATLSLLALMGLAARRRRK